MRVELVMKILNHGATDDRQIIKSICSSFCLCLFIFFFSHSSSFPSVFLVAAVPHHPHLKRWNECTQWNWLSIKEEILHLNFKYVHRLLLPLSVNSIYWYWLMFPVMLHKSKSNMLFTMRCEWYSLIWYESSCGTPDKRRLFNFENVQIYGWEYNPGRCVRRAWLEIYNYTMSSR